MRSSWCSVLLTLALAGTLGGGAAVAGPERNPWRLPIATRTLANGLTVIVSEDHSVTTFGLCTAYRIGFRSEPKGHAGFAHLFEHMMFQGTPRAPKGVLNRVVEAGGGKLAGATNWDHTIYTAAAPVSALDAVLWLESDRMRTLDFSAKGFENQKDVVKEEIRANVINQPYGLFYWTDLGSRAFGKWENNHDGYGSFADLDAATLADVESFFEAYYGPNSAVIAVVGDVTPDEVFAKVEKYFGDIPPRPRPLPPDTSEGPNTAERTLVETDPLARIPALAVGWKLPASSLLDHVPAALLANLLLSGEAARLPQRLVKDRKLMLNVQGGLNWPLGDPWTYTGPALLTVNGMYKPPASAESVIAAIDEIVEDISRHGVPDAELTRTKTKMESDLYSTLELPVDRAAMLASLQLLTGNAGVLTDLLAAIAAVTSADLQRVAATYLTAANRTVVDRRPVSSGQPAAKGKGNAP
ncbi:MAG TPA: pitrilysin family protein [Thermoanaerobaculia bacterium]|nr:pitrilysin family protein [Thermoanaerobaculia bacterium]